MKLSRREWIRMYGENNYLEDLIRLGFWAVPCLNCTDTICHGWKMERIRLLAG